MKTLKISAFKFDEKSEKSIEMLNKELKKAGFDLHKPIERFKSTNSFNYLFIQEDGND